MCEWQALLRVAVKGRRHLGHHPRRNEGAGTAGAQIEPVFEIMFTTRRAVV